MKKVDYCTYNDDKLKFFRKHKGLYDVHTSPMINDCYHKEYVCKDGKIFYESMTPDYDEVIMTGVSLKSGTTITERKSVKYMRTEYWNSDDASSKVMYEVW